MRIQAILCSLFVLLLSAFCLADSPSGDNCEHGDALVGQYFEAQTRELTRRAFAEIETLDDWLDRRDEYQRQLHEMLGLDPFPKKTPLKTVVTGTVEHGDFMVERLHFQSMPGLYVTGNLYRPVKQQGPLPAVLYVCGHGGAKKNGVSYGNKTRYQHHGAWFARNGYVCLTIDTIQLGEIEGVHHGTYRERMWWWNNRGYTPAGVEAWNCIRSLDYLQSREEVDGARLGVTGRSGGGAYSWWIAAIDERIQVAVPVAGITSLHNHVVDGCVEGHCDCMFMVNTYQWDYPMVAALVAPRPLLISNSDKDRIFPLDGIIDVHKKVRRIYELYDASDKLGLQITEGPHKDTQELRVHAFRWFNRFLKQDDGLIDSVATSFFEPEQLKVFDRLPDDQRVTSIHESFVPAVSADSLPLRNDELQAETTRWMQSLKDRCFRGWPAESDRLNVKLIAQTNVQTNAAAHDAVKIRAFEFTSQQPFRLRMYVIGRENTDRLTVNVLDQSGWDTVSPALAALLPEEFPGVVANSVAGNELATDVRDRVVAYVVPRGVGLTQWSSNERTRTHIRRRFMQLGQTEASMQIYDIRRAMQALDDLPEYAKAIRDIDATGEAAIWAMYASLFEDRIGNVTLRGLPSRNRDAPDILNVSRFVDMPQLVMMMSARSETLTLIGDRDNQDHSWHDLGLRNELFKQRIRVIDTDASLNQ